MYNQWRIQKFRKGGPAPKREGGAREKGGARAPWAPPLNPPLIINKTAKHKKCVEESKTVWCLLLLIHCILPIDFTWPKKERLSIDCSIAKPGIEK
jgi:hypothetical protein